MRELKYRAFDKAMNKMIFVGFHIMGEVTAFGLIEQWIMENKCGRETSLERWNDIEISEYTGKQDKNGDDIYDEDYLKYKNVVMRVFWDNNRAGYFVAYENIYNDCAGKLLYKSLGWAANKDIEIIGSKFEKPEILK